MRASLLILTLSVGLVIAGVAPAAAANSTPTAEIDYTPSDPVVDDTVTLDASASTDGDGTIEEYRWDLNGDGDYDDYNDGDGQTAQISYSSAGTYTVGLEVTDDGGATDTTTVGITVTNEKPEADFTFSPTDPVVDETISLDASPSTDSDGRITEYEWDFNGDGDYDDYNDGDGQTESISFAEGGVYSVGLKVYDNGEKVDTIQKDIEVANEPPTADFEFTPAEPVPDERVDLDASTSSDSDGDIVSYEWDLNGDGDYDDYNDGDGQTTDKTFDTAGSYTIGLKVTDNGDLAAEERQTITVTNEEPVPEFAVEPSTPHPDEQVRLDASASRDEDGNIVSYEWDLNGDGDYDDYNDGDGQSVTTEFATGGSYTVGLRITDNGEVSTTTTRTITVTNTPPTANFSYSLTGDGLTVQLDGSPSTDPDDSGRITSYQWDLNGDGDYDDYEDASGQSPAVEFESAGEYEIGLQVTDNGDLTKSVRRTVAVSAPPKAAFSMDPVIAATGQPATFDASDSVDPDGDIETYRWTFPDGTTKQGEEVTYQFGSVGSYEVELTVVDSFGATATTTSEVQVREPPTFSTHWSPEVPRNKLDVVFSGTSSDAVNEYKWDFDADGEFEETGAKVTHSFEETGKHTIRVRGVAPSGVAATKTKIVTVQQSASFELTTNKQSIQSGDTVIVTFSASNLVRDKPLVARLELSLPTEGASISGVSGSEMASSRATDFVTIDPGEERSIQVRVQYTGSDAFDVGGEAVYYFGTENNSTADRRRTNVTAATVSVQSDGAASGGSQTSTPGFGGGVAACALLIAVLLRGRGR